MRPTPRYVKKQIAELYDSGVSMRSISDTVNLSISTISMILKKERSDTLRMQGGRPRRLSEPCTRRVRRLVFSGNSAREVSSQLCREGVADVVLQSIRVSMHRFGHKGRKRVRKPYLSKRHRKLRMDFATAHEHWTVHDWAPVVWSDETKISRFETGGSLWTWGTPGEELGEKGVIPSVKYGGGHIMIWACMSRSGVWHVRLVQGNLNATQYVEILEENFAPSIETMGLDPPMVIFQDNDPKHTSHCAQRHLRGTGFEVMRWPPQSPDSNPIENVWGELKRRLAGHDDPPSGVRELWERVKMEWANIPPSVCRA